MTYGDRMTHAVDVPAARVTDTPTPLTGKRTRSATGPISLPDHRVRGSWDKQAA